MSNTILFYIISACQMAWFTESIWYFYFRGFTDYATMGIVFAILNIFWIAFELPTGLIADKFGRKLSTVLGAIFVTLSQLSLAFANSFWMWIVALLIGNLGRAFISGALEALIYDDLKTQGNENLFTKITAKKSQIVIAVYTLAVISGGFIGHFNLRIPYLLHALFSFVSIIAAIRLSEVKIHTSHLEPRTSNPFSAVLAGLNQFRVPALKPYLLLSWLLLFVYFVFDWGMTKPAMSVKFGFFEREQGVIFALSGILMFFTLPLIPKLKTKISEINGLYLFAAIMLSSFSLAIFPLGILGVIPILFIEATGAWSEPWISNIMNLHIDSKYRATTLSALQMFGRLPYLLINPVIGHLIDRQKINLVFMGLSAIIGLIIIINYSLSKLRDSETLRNSVTL